MLQPAIFFILPSSTLSCHHQRRQAFVSLAIITSNVLYLYLYLILTYPIFFIFILPSSTSQNVCFTRHHHQRYTLSLSLSYVMLSYVILSYLYLYLAIINVAQRLFRSTSSPAMHFIFIFILSYLIFYYPILSLSSSLSCHHQRRQAFVSLAIITRDALALYLYLYLYLAIINVAKHLFRSPSSPAMHLH